MKKYFYIAMSVSLVVVTVVGCFLTLEKRSHDKEQKEHLNKHYFKEFSNAYYILLDPDAKEWRINLGHNWVQETEDHMSKDGYNWQQIKGMKRWAESEQEAHHWNKELGYNDGVSGQDSCGSYSTDLFYMYGFKKGRAQMKSKDYEDVLQ